MVVKLLKQKALICLWICTYNLAAIASELTNITFINKLDFTNKVCPAVDTISIGIVASKIVCGYLCFNMADCKDFSFSPTDLTCTGCKKSYNTPSQLDELSGNMFFSPVSTACVDPVVIDTHVKLGPIKNISQIGDEVNYTCDPCTFFPLVEPAVITCQANGTWSVPKCVFGPDVGRLSNGQTIPPGSIGCASVFNTTCLAFGIVSGNALWYDGRIAGGCVCSDECCFYEDCCYDCSCFQNEDYA